MPRRDSAAPLPPDDDPVGRSLDEAPWDDEPLTEEDVRTIEEAKRDAAEGRVYSQDEVRRFLGLDEE